MAGTMRRLARPTVHTAWRVAADIDPGRAVTIQAKTSTTVAITKT
jgi:hypothetical protein